VNPTNPYFDPATTGTATTTNSANWIFSPEQHRWFPIIRGAQDDSASDDSGTSPDGGSGDSDQGASGGTSTDKDDSSKGKVFSQDEVSALVAREVAKAQRGKLDPKELGFDSMKDLQSFVTESKAAADAAKTDAEKVVEEAAQQAAEAARAEVLDVAGNLVLKAEFLIAAKDHGVKFPHDAYELVQSLKEWEPVDLEEDGSVVGIDDGLFEALKAQKPFLFEPPTSTDIGAGARGTGQTSTDDIRAKYPALKAPWYGGAAPSGR
jgi:hypothetical protein